MAPKPMPWFRFYCEAMQDRKLRRLPVVQRWTWVAVLCAARQSPQPGLLLVGADAMNADDIADIAGVSVKDAQASLDAFAATGLIEDVDGVWSVVSWGKRQYDSDSSTKRVRKHRDETTMERPIDVPCNAQSPLMERPQRTETETDTEPVRRKQLQVNRTDVLAAAAEIVVSRRDLSDKSRGYVAAAVRGVHTDLVAWAATRKLDGHTPTAIADQFEPPPTVGPKLREVNGRMCQHIPGTGFVPVGAA